MMDFTKLRNLISSHFNKSELRNLAYDLRINHENLPGETLHDLSRELIEWCRRHQQIEELIAQCKSLRPKVDWNSIYQELVNRNHKYPFLVRAEIIQQNLQIETIFIPAGSFLMGIRKDRNISNESIIEHEVELPSYHIGKYPVTNQEYAEFVKQTKYPVSKNSGWFGKKPPQSKLDHPVVGISWYNALNYCQWLSKQTNQTYRLPTEAEWEKAARGTEGIIYPWGNSWNAEYCNWNNSDTTPVTTYQSGQSPYGCYDMVGNVWEWTSTLWGHDWQESSFAYPYRPNDGREDLAAPSTVHRIFRGGAFNEDKTKLNCTVRRWYAPTHQSKNCGFRVVLEET